MARLLNRMRGGTDAPAAAPVRPTPVAETPAPVVEEPLLEPIETAFDPQEPLNMVPRGTAAAACDMAAMRELANMSVHSALSAHRKNHRRRKVIGKWALTCMAAVMSVTLTFQAIEGEELGWYATVMGWCVTVVCAAGAGLMSRQLLAETKPARTSASEESQSPAAE